MARITESLDALNKLRLKVVNEEPLTKQERIFLTMLLQRTRAELNSLDIDIDTLLLDR